MDNALAQISRQGKFLSDPLVLRCVVARQSVKVGSSSSPIFFVKLIITGLFGL
jgi:hypothetical protein